MNDVLWKPYSDIFGYLPGPFTNNIFNMFIICRFSAIARFTYGPAQGCGGRWDIRGEDTTEIQSHDEDGDGNYEPELNCQWVLLGDPGKVLKLTFTASSFNIERDSNATSVTCWDYVEVRDGFSPFAPLIGHFCGSQAPTPIIASSNSLWVKFFRYVCMFLYFFLLSIMNCINMCI